MQAEITMSERFSRAQRWPLYIPRIYIAVRRAGTAKSRIETLRFAQRWFHAWVWNLAVLPWDARL